MPEQADRIDELLAVAREADAGLAQVRQGATYAGDPDPYRTSESDEAPAGVDGAPPAGHSSDS